MTTGGSSTKLEPGIPAAAQGLWNKLLEGMGKMGQPYGGQMTAPLSNEQNMGLKLLDQYAGGSTSGLSNIGTKLAADTVGGKYLNPDTNPYLKRAADTATMATRTGLAQDMNASNAMFGRAGMGLGSAERNWQQKLLTNANTGLFNNLNNMYLSNYNTERGVQNSMLPMLNQYAQQPLQTAGALMQYGQVPQQNAQQGLTANYSDWMRQLQSPYNYGMQLLSGMPLEYPQYYNQPDQTSQFMNSIGNILLGLGPYGAGVFGKTAAAAA